MSLKKCFAAASPVRAALCPPAQVTLSEPSAPCESSRFQAEPVDGRRVSKVVKTTVVHGERMEKHLGDPRFASDLPSAKADFEEVRGPRRRVRAVCATVTSLPVRVRGASRPRAAVPGPQPAQGGAAPRSRGLIPGTVSAFKNPGGGSISAGAVLRLWGSA